MIKILKTNEDLKELFLVFIAMPNLKRKKIVSCPGSYWPGGGDTEMSHSRR